MWVIEREFGLDGGSNEEEVLALLVVVVQSVCAEAAVDDLGIGCGWARNTARKFARKGRCVGMVVLILYFLLWRYNVPC